MASSSSASGRKWEAKTAGTMKSTSVNGVNLSHKSMLKDGTSSEESPDECRLKGEKGACSKGAGRKRMSPQEALSEASADVPKKRSKSPAKRDTGEVSVPAKSTPKKKTAASTEGRKQKATPKGQFQSVDPPEDSCKSQASDMPSGVALKGNNSQATDIAGKEEQSVVKRKKGNQPIGARLPPEVLMEIFSYLNKDDLLGAALVCSSWSKVGFSMLKDVKLHGRELTVQRAELVVRALNKNVRKVELHGWNRKMIDPILIAIGDCLPDLESLTIGEGYTGGSALAYVMAKCAKITELSIEVVPKDGSRHPLNCLPTEWSVSKFLFREPVFMTDTPDMSVARQWDTLREVSLSSYEGDNEFEFVVAACGGQLRKLRVRRLTKTESYLALAKLPLLEELQINDAKWMSDYDFFYGVGTLTNLQKLTIKGARNMTPATLWAFLSRENVVGKLLTLDLSNSCADFRHLYRIADKCPLLTSLSIKLCKKITINALLHLVKELPIKHLDLYECFPERKMIINIRKIKAVRQNITIDHTSEFVPFEE